MTSLTDYTLTFPSALDSLKIAHKIAVKLSFSLVLQVEASLDLFMKKFDIVLVDDQTMRVPMEILRKILQ